MLEAFGRRLLHPFFGWPEFAGRGEVTWYALSEILKLESQPRCHEGAQAKVVFCPIIEAYSKNSLVFYSNPIDSSIC